MSNKKIISVALLAMSVCAVSSCGTVEAKPTFYKDNIIADKADLYHNTMSLVYDAVTNASSQNEKELNHLLGILADQMFGTWEDVQAMAAKSATDADVKAFFGAHSYYNDDYTDEVRFTKLQNFKKAIEEKISAAIYSEISGGTYSYRSEFYENRYVSYLKSCLYDLGDYVGNTTGVLLKEDGKKDISIYLSDLTKYKDYTDTLVEKYYREMIVEDYMYKNNQALLSRTYARKINYIALKADTGSTTYARKILSTFADKYLKQDKRGEAVAPVDENGYLDFSLINKAWNGLPEDLADENVKNLLEDAGFATKTAVIDEDTANVLGVTYALNAKSEESLSENDVCEITYYRGTKFASMFDKYVTITDDRNSTKNDSEFTDSNAHTKYVGLSNKIKEIKLNDYTTDGWYTKNGTSTNLPSEISARLFKIGTANALDSAELVKDKEYKAQDYLRNVNGINLLVPETSQRNDDYNYVIYDDATTTYYMVQVLEGISVSKINGGYSEIHADDKLFTETILREIAKLYKDNSTYRKNAYVSLMEEFTNKVWHDQSTYDYFVAQFPELFNNN